MSIRNADNFGASRLVPIPPWLLIPVGGIAAIEAIGKGGKGVIKSAVFQCIIET